MKQNIFYLLFVLLLFGACNKNLQEVQAPDKVGLLFSQLKQEPQFLEYLKSVQKSVQMLNKSIEGLRPEDSTILRDRSISFEEKKRLLALKVPENINDSYKQASESLAIIRIKYPVFDSLSQDERKLLFQKGYKYYFKSSSK